MKKNMLAVVTAICLALPATVVCAPPAAALGPYTETIHDDDPAELATKDSLKIITRFTNGDEVNTRRKEWKNEDIQRRAVAVANYYKPTLLDEEKLAVLKIFFAADGQQWNKIAHNFSYIKTQRCTVSFFGCKAWNDPVTKNRPISGARVSSMYQDLPMSFKEQLWGSVAKSVLKARSVDGSKIGKGWGGPSPYEEMVKHKGDATTDLNEGSSINQGSASLGSSKKNNGNDSDHPDVMLIVAMIVALGGIAAAVATNPQLIPMPR